MAQALPLANIPAQSFETVLAGQHITMTVWWQPGPVDGNWYFSLALQSGEYSIRSRRIVPGCDLLAGLSPGFTGLLFCVRLLPFSDEYPGEPSESGPWGVTHRLAYEPLLT